MPSDASTFTRRFSRATVSGSGASLLSAMAVAWRASCDSKSACQGINGPSHWIWGERAFFDKNPSWRYTAIGLAIHHVSSIFWAFFFEWLIEPGKEAEPLYSATKAAEESSVVSKGGRPVSPLGICAASMAIATLANIVDYKVTPCRLRPGFERRLTRPSLALVYFAFGAGLAATALWRSRR